MRDRDPALRAWHVLAVLAAAVAVSIAAVHQVQRDRIARARKLGVSVVALSNPERFMRRLRSEGGI